MTLRWTEHAAIDLESIANYLFDHAPDRAEDLVNRIYAAPADLLTFPLARPAGQEAGNA